MFAKKFRISADEFYRKSIRATRFKGKYLSFFIKPSKNSEIRIAVAVSARLEKRSTKRHAMKRMLVEALRPSLADLPKGYCLLIKVEKVFSNTQKSQVVQELQWLLTLVFEKGELRAKITS